MHKNINALGYDGDKMRSYGQYCALAKALDLVGDRWTLLIVRELLLRGSCRYTDLRDGLPGIATNLLVERLRELESAGLIAREHAPPPIATTLFSLTPRGRELRPALHELSRFGVPYMSEGPEPNERFRSSWLAWPAELFLSDRDPQLPPIEIELRSDGGSTTVRAHDGEVHARAGAAEHPDAVISGTPHAILALLSGKLDPSPGSSPELELEGDLGALRRLLPSAPAGA